MRRFQKTAFHDTAVLQKNSVAAEELTDFTQGDHVMTCDGFPGRVTAVLFGPYQGTENYQVELDGGMGGGDYSPGQLTPIKHQTASREVEAIDYTASIPTEASTDHTADLDYPELGSILMDRQPIENLRLTAALNDKAKPDIEKDPKDDQDDVDEGDDDDDPAADDPEVDEDEQDPQSAEVGDVTPPSACSFCGNATFGDPQMTGRGVRMRCEQCHGTMKSWGGQWEPEFPNSSQNNASETWDYRSGGPGGKGQAPGGEAPAQQQSPLEGDDEAITQKSARSVFASMDRMALAESLQSEAGIVQYLFNRLYLKAREKERQETNEWWRPSPEQFRIYDTPFDGQQHYTGSVSEYNDPDWHWHFTASWMDVQAKARKIRKDAGVKIVAASNVYVTAEVRGDYATYETQLNYVPGTRKVADWACGCKWASYAWGRSKRYQRFEGRLCSHALATQYEANSRGIFGRDVKPDVQFPDWQKAHSPVVVQYDRGQSKDLTRRAVPPANMKRTFSSLVLDTDGVYPEPARIDLAHPPVFASVQTMIDNDADLVDVITMLASMNVDKDDARSMVFEVLASDLDVQVDGEIGTDEDAKDQLPASSGKKKHHHDEPDRGWGYGYGIGWGPCGYCGGAGCDRCDNSGQVPADDPASVGDGGAVDGGATSSLHTADYASNDSLVGMNGAEGVPTSVPHSNSENPASSGWATSQDPGDWGRSLISTDFGVTTDASLHVTGLKEGEGSDPTVSGVMLKAKDTGRILMIQRSNKDKSDPARGSWEAPGGHHEENDLTSLHAGIREWEEEVGQPFPHGGHLTDVHRSGPYALHTVVIPEESQVDFSKGRSEHNPDDPDGDDHEQAAWWDPDHAKKNPALRSELKKMNPFEDIKKAAAHTILAMPWHQLAPGETPAAMRAKSVRQAGFKGYVRSSEDYDDDLQHDEFDEDLYDHVTPEPTHEEQAHYDEHGEYPESHYERHDRAYADAMENRREEDRADHEDDHLHHFVHEHGSDDHEWTRHEAQPQKIDLRHGVYATQSHVSQKHIDKYLADPDADTHRGRSDSGYLGDEHPMFVTHNDDLHATEGHHRVAAALQRGDTHIMGWHYNLDKHPVAQTKDYHTAQREDCYECKWHNGDSEDEDHWSHEGRKIADLQGGATDAALDFESRMADPSSLNDEPEPALPSTTGDSEDDQVDEPDDLNTTAAIVEQFQRTAGGRALAKEAMKDFSFTEQQDLINEGKGDRARNFNDLKIAGTHYALIPEEAAEDESILWV